MNPEICVVIPTLNEAQTIADVLRGVRPFCRRVLVIDGGSGDETQNIVRALMEDDSGIALEVFTSRGKGRALRRALDIVQERVTVFIDADGSHDPIDIPALAAPVLSGAADMVVASRWEGGSDELHGDLNKWIRRTGSRILTILVNSRFQGQMTDIQNGFRAVSTKIGREIGLEADDFTIEQEMVMKFLGGNYRVVSVPSHEYARQGGEAKLNLRKVWFRFGIVVLNHLFGLSRPKTRRARRRKKKSHL
ncbi:MAG TPA: glycosyltransferase family 2 protein [Abditibacterium sp.]|jgi:dolichol-phosphate mannosyltransferase